MDDDSYFTLKEYARKLKLSRHTIYRNPTNFFMFRVGGSWRANRGSLKKFELAQFNDNNIYRLSVVGGRRISKCRSTKEVKNTGLISHLQMEEELDNLLTPRTK